MTEQQLTTTFDYSQLDKEIQRKLLEQEEQLDLVLKRTRKDIGLILLEIRKLLMPGQLYAWCASKGMSKSTAWRCMQEAEGKLISSPKPDNLMDVFQNETQQYEAAGQILDIQDLPAEKPYQYATNSSELGDVSGVEWVDDAQVEEGTDIDVAALLARSQQQETIIQELTNQLQQTTAPARRYGGGHHAPSATIQDNGLTHRWNPGTKSRQITEVFREVGAGKGGFDTSVSEDKGNSDFFYANVEFSSPKLPVSIKLKKHSRWAGYVAEKLEELAKEIRKYNQ